MRAQTEILMTLFFALTFFSACGLKATHETQPGGEAGSSVPLKPTYASIATNIIAAKCLSCHNGPNSAKRVDLSSYDTILANTNYPPLVLPGKPEQSSLYTAIVTGYMPRYKSALRGVEMQAVLDWIQNGAKDGAEE